MKSSPHDRALDRCRRHRRRLHGDRRRRSGRDGDREHLPRADARRHRDLNGLTVVLCGHQSASRSPRGTHHLYGVLRRRDANDGRRLARRRVVVRRGRRRVVAVVERAARDGIAATEDTEQDDDDDSDSRPNNRTGVLLAAIALAIRACFFLPNISAGAQPGK